MQEIVDKMLRKILQEVISKSKIETRVMPITALDQLYKTGLTKHPLLMKICLAVVRLVACNKTPLSI